MPSLGILTLPQQKRTSGNPESIPASPEASTPLQSHLLWVPIFLTSCPTWPTDPNSPSVPRLSFSAPHTLCQLPCPMFLRSGRAPQLLEVGLCGILLERSSDPHRSPRTSTEDKRASCFILWWVWGPCGHNAILRKQQPFHKGSTDCGIRSPWAEPRDRLFNDKTLSPVRSGSQLTPEQREISLVQSAQNWVSSADPNVSVTPPH